MRESHQKDERILSLYTRLQRGEVLRKAEEAHRFCVNEKSIQRDIESLRAFLEEEHNNQTIVYDKRLGGYRMDTRSGKLTNGEVLAVCKILLESRSLPKKDMDMLLEKLLQCCVPESNKKVVDKLIANEQLHYIEPHHGVSLFERLWDIGTAVQEQRVLEITYEKMNHETVTRIVEPAAIMFSEYYFYLTAFIRNIDREKEFENANDLFPTIYRIDRIKKYKISCALRRPVRGGRVPQARAVYVRRQIADHQISLYRPVHRGHPRPPADRQGSAKPRRHMERHRRGVRQGRGNVAEGAESVFT